MRAYRLLSGLKFQSPLAEKKVFNRVMLPEKVHDTKGIEKEYSKVNKWPFEYKQCYWGEKYPGYRGQSGPVDQDKGKGSVHARADIYGTLVGIPYARNLNPPEK